MCLHLFSIAVALLACYFFVGIVPDMKTTELSVATAIAACNRKAGIMRCELYPCTKCADQSRT